MNILYYIPFIGQDMGGIRQYAVALLKILSTDKSNRYFIYHEVNDPEIMAAVDSNPHITLVKSSQTKWGRKLKKLKTSILTRFITSPSPEQEQLSIICKNHKINIIHAPYQYLAQAHNVRSICTMHDVQELIFPAYFTPEDRAHRAVHYSNHIKNADKIIVSYQHIKNDIIKYFKVPADKVDVCLLEMDNLWFSKYNVDDLEPLNAIGANDTFVFYPANTWEHKNHLQLLQAILVLKQQGLISVKLVCTGHKTPYFDEVLKPFIEQHQLQNHVVFPGVLPEKTLFSLYKQCLGVVVPTLYEAGSFPLMEAILMGVPVICSNVTSLPETIGDPQFLFDPNDATAISDKLKLLWESPEYREKSIANCSKQVHRLIHTGAFEKIMDIYSRLKN